MRPPIGGRFDITQYSGARQEGPSIHIAKEGTTRLKGCALIAFAGPLQSGSGSQCQLRDVITTAFNLNMITTPRYAVALAMRVATGTQTAEQEGLALARSTANW